MQSKKIRISIIILFSLVFLNTNLYASPKEFISKLTSDASKVLANQQTKDQKMIKLIELAEENVDIKGIGLYSLGKHRKVLDESLLKEYELLFKEYFLKSFSSRLSEYTDPKINVLSEEVINTKYTIVFSVLEADEKRPEIKIDWRVYTLNPEKPLVRDLIIEGLSLARTQKEEFSSILNSNDNDIKSLFKILEEFSKN